MTILIADDEEVVRRCVRHALEDAGFTVCGEAVNGYEAVEKAAELAPDIIVLDWRMPLLDGMAVASVLKLRTPASKIILLTVYEIGGLVTGVPGVAAIVSKTRGLDELLDCVRQLANAGHATKPE